MRLYGYIVDDSIEYKISSGIMINLKNGKTAKVKKTDKSLLELIFHHYRKGWLSDELIINNVFEKSGLRYSHSRVRGVIKKISIIFAMLGFYNDIVQRHNGRGYYINLNKLELLYIYPESESAGCEVINDIIVCEKQINNQSCNRDF